MPAHVYRILLCTVFLLAACHSGKLYYHPAEKNWTQQQPATQQELIYQLYLIGDAGEDPAWSGPVLQTLQQDLQKAGKRSGVIFLGDNIYPAGLHKSSDPLRSQDETRLNAQLDIVKSYDGKVVFIPGNHDWNKGRDKGLNQVNRQEKYIREYLNRKNVFQPENGCPGPEVLELAPGLVLVVLDTQWWLHPYEKSSGEKDDCSVRTPQELMVAFKEVLKKYRDQHVIVAAHHPLYSNGNHGGHFTWKDHLFPFTAKFPHAYVPLPGIGSIYPLYRKMLGNIQDIPHPVYQDMQRQLVQAMNAYENVVYVAGHEHNLQYISRNQTHYLISGSGSKITHVAHNRSIRFGAEEKGFSRMSWYTNGEVWLEYLTPGREPASETVIFRKKLYEKKPLLSASPQVSQKPSYQGQYETVVPEPSYAASRTKRFFLGDLNRDLWTTPIRVPYLDIHFEKGGLTPLKKGGGMQTLSLRLKGADGLDYSVRGIQKNTQFLVPKNLQGTLAQDVVYDGLAGSHPYASVVIPPLADAVGIYHTNPKLVVLPNDSILGDYRAEFAHRLCLFEERPEGDMSAQASFGHSKKVVSHADALEKMHSKSTHRVDVAYAVRARLFDMVLGDWDRHDDQWRWATFDTGNQTLYRPIPRDRDQAFFQFDGLIPSVVNRKWLMRKFQPFRPHIRDMAGQNFNARYFDRSFLSEASQDVWVQQAVRLKTHLTDSVIEVAIRQFPPEAFQISGEKIMATLKARRDQTEAFARRYYAILAREVDITGTLNDDYIEVLHLPPDRVEVSLYAWNKDTQTKNDTPYYHRLFDRATTREIRVYGLDGHDQYHVSGTASHSPLVRFIAGPDKDQFQDSSSVAGVGKKNRLYDSQGKNTIQAGSETRVRIRPDTRAYDYDRKEFRYNVYMPLPSLGYNPIDGLFVGPALQITTHGFKKSPYKSRHTLSANLAGRTGAFNVSYTYDFTNLLGPFDVAGHLTVQQPLVFTFYGEGNETRVNTDEQDSFRIRLHTIQFHPYLKLDSRDHAHRVEAGVYLQHAGFDTPLTPTPGRETQTFAGPVVGYTYLNQDHPLNPNRGIRFSVNGSWNRNLHPSNLSYFHVQTELAAYIPVSFMPRQTTLALRSGLATNQGEYYFYQSNFLSGPKNFRGINRNRFAGKTSSYTNLEVRLSLLNVRNYVAPFDLGVLGHYDLARVWTTQEVSTRWHTSAGGGLYAQILDYLLLAGTFSVSDTDSAFLLGTQFLF